MELFLSSMDYNDFYVVRKVLSFRKCVIEGRDCLIVDVDQFLNGEKYGVDHDIVTFYLLDKWIPPSMLSLSKFPIRVHVLIKKNYREVYIESLSQLSNIAWATLYDNYSDAVQYK